MFKLLTFALNFLRQNLNDLNNLANSLLLFKVCGSDGNNYHSECAMHAMTCSDVIGNYDVVTVHKRGKCGFDEGQC